MRVLKNGTYDEDDGRHAGQRTFNTLKDRGVRVWVHWASAAEPARYGLHRLRDALALGLLALPDRPIAGTSAGNCL